MKASALKYTILSWVSAIIMVILLVVPFHAFVTVWGSSLVGHYTALRLWKEALLFISAIGVLYLLATDKKIRSHTLTRRLVWVILAYGALNFIWGGLALLQHDVTPKALGYGLIVNLRFLAFFLIIWAVALRMGRLRNNWRGFVLWPAAIVVIFGIVQVFILPNDFLRHFGYGADIISPFETINHNAQYIRIASFLRGANPLGAYLVIPISILTVLIASGRRSWKHILLLVGSLVVLFFSFSRSAWIGAAISIAIILVLSLRTKRTKQITMLAGAAGFIVFAGIVYGFRHNARVDNFLYHTQDNSAVKTTSNHGHVVALKAGLKDIKHQPLGDGVGTAGPASVYNGSHPARIAENYYIQIAQEVGILGLGLFLLINAGVGYLLWLRRSDPLALALFASLIGISFINLLSHAWTDDTLAYVWWGLAGIAMVRVASDKQ